MAIPKVFISYSHDTLAHKKWVLDLATRLRNNGIDAILDQWELNAGDDLPHFMETHLAKSDFVIMVCTEKYVIKANAGKGGVGYEKMIITSSLLDGIDANKVIPILREKGEHSVPTFLKTKLYVDFSKNDDFEFSYDELIRTIHKSPLYKKPEVGNKPFKEIDENIELKSHDGILELMKVIVHRYEYYSADYVLYDGVRENINISRIMLDILIKEACDLEYIRISTTHKIYLLDKGKYYAIDNKLME